jgi:hypothetical protein
VRKRVWSGLYELLGGLLVGLASLLLLDGRSVNEKLTSSLTGQRGSGHQGGSQAFLEILEEQVINVGGCIGVDEYENGSIHVCRVRMYK